MKAVLLRRQMNLSQMENAGLVRLKKLFMKGMDYRTLNLAI